MTRKDYKVIANALHPIATNPLLTRNESNAVENAVIALAKALQAENPRFDEMRFHDAVYAERIADSNL